MKILGIDIGGSAVKGAPVETKNGELLEERFRVATPDVLPPAELAEAIAEVVAHFRWRGRVGIGFPGVVHGPRILTSANLHKDFIGCDAGTLFAKATGRPVSLVNDADAAGLAEVRFGAGRGVNGTILVLTLGTGIGSALFCRGTLYQNSELGQLPWRGDKSVEKFMSAAARKKLDLDWKEWSERLNTYFATLERILWPERIIIGGGVSAKHHKFFRYLKTRAKLVPAEFRNEAGIVGAALWAEGQRHG